MTKIRPQNNARITLTEKSRMSGTDPPTVKNISTRSETLVFIGLMLLIVASTFLSFTAIELIKITMNHGQPMTLREWVWGSIISLAALFAFAWWFKIPLQTISNASDT